MESLTHHDMIPGLAPAKPAEAAIFAPAQPNFPADRRLPDVAKSGRGAAWATNRAALGKLSETNGELSGELVTEQDLPAGSKLGLVASWRQAGLDRYLVLTAELKTLGGPSKRKRRARLSCDMR